MSWHIAHVATGTSFLALRGFDLKVNYSGVERLVVLFELKGITVRRSVRSHSCTGQFYARLETPERFFTAFKLSGEQTMEMTTFQFPTEEKLYYVY